MRKEGALLFAGLETVFGILIGVVVAMLGKSAVALGAISMIEIERTVESERVW